MSINNDALYLNDLLAFEDLSNVKIRFNQPNTHSDPMEEYKKDPDRVCNDWLFWRTKQRFFSVGQIVIGLLPISNDIWLHTTIKAS